VPSLIELKNLQCEFDKRVILENVSVKIKNHLSILGANGSGKSTLAKAICGLSSYEGTIHFNGVDIQELSPKQKAKAIAYIPAKLDIYDSFISVEEFVLLGRFAYKKNFFDYSKEDKAIALEMLEFLQVSHLKSNAVSSLSSGEQQLVLIAQALAQQSDTIIVDEPTANLDPYNSKIIAQQIQTLKQSHQIILITHDIHLASYVNSPVLFIKDTKAYTYEKEFFQNETLQKLYGVVFDSLVVQYE